MDLKTALGEYKDNATKTPDATQTAESSVLEKQKSALETLIRVMKNKNLRTDLKDVALGVAGHVCVTDLLRNNKASGIAETDPNLFLERCAKKIKFINEGGKPEELRIKRVWHAKSKQKEMFNDKSPAQMIVDEIITEEFRLILLLRKPIPAEHEKALQLLQLLHDFYPDLKIG